MYYISFVQEIYTEQEWNELTAERQQQDVHDTMIEMRDAVLDAVNQELRSSNYNAMSLQDAIHAGLTIHSDVTQFVEDEMAGQGDSYSYEDNTGYESWMLSR